MPTTDRILRVLVVDDNRDGADALGLLVEELGNQVHVTYGGAKALEVVTAFRPDLMLVDLLMPDMDGSGLVRHIREIPDFAQIKIVAITGQKDEERNAAAVRAGFNTVLIKPVSLSEIKGVLANVDVVHPARPARRAPERVSPPDERRLPIVEARKIRNQRQSKALTQNESEAAICDGILRFQEEYMGWRSEQISSHLIKDLLVVRILGVLTLAERQLGRSLSPEKGRNLIKQARNQLLELARPMIESLVHEVTGVKVLSMHHDLSTATGEELIVFSLSGTPRLG